MEIKAFVRGSRRVIATLFPSAMGLSNRNVKLLTSLCFLQTQKQLKSMHFSKVTVGGYGVLLKFLSLSQDCCLFSEAGWLFLLDKGILD